MVVKCGIVLAPEPSVGRDSGEQTAAGDADTPQLEQRGAIVVEVLEHVGRQDQIERVIRKRQAFDSSLARSIEPSLPAELDRRRRCVDALSMAERPKFAQVAPSAAPRVEDPHAGRDARPVEQRPYHRAPPLEPPV